eukprot:3644609-Prymnesium_polylepis.2
MVGGEEEGNTLPATVLEETMDTEDRPDLVGDDMDDDSKSPSSLSLGDLPPTESALPQVDKLEANAQVEDQVWPQPTEESH